MPTAQHRDFGQGAIQDEASFLTPEGALFSAKNMLFDKIGITRKRGGITGFSGVTNTGAQYMGALVDDTATPIFYVFGVSGATNLAYMNHTTGVYTVLQSNGWLPPSVTANGAGKPFQHYGFLVFPNWVPTSGLSNPGVIAVAGAKGTVNAFSLANPATCVITAGLKRIPVNVADNPTTKMEVGTIIFLTDNAGVDNYYVGRIINIQSSTAIDVYPTPTRSFTPSFGYAESAWEASNAAGITGGGNKMCGQCGMSFQGRACFGNIYIGDSAGTRVENHPRRVIFSSTLLEGDAGGDPAQGIWQGAVFLTNNGYPALNYFDVPGADPITAMSPTGFGDAIIFSPFRAYRLTGNLSTQYGTTSSITWAVREIPNSVGCITEQSLQRTSRGLVFANEEGIFVTDGQSMRPVLQGRMANYWKALVSFNPGFFKIYGSAIIRGNHYYISGQQSDSGNNGWALLINLDTLAVSTLAGLATAGPGGTTAAWLSTAGVQDPGAPSRTFALKWMPTAARAVTNGQLVQLDKMLDPTSANRNDSEGTVVNFEAVTRSYAEDSPTMQKVWEKATVEYENIGGAAVAVTPAAILDASEIPAGGTNYFLPRQDVYTITAATNATPIVVTCGTHDIKVDSWVHVQGVGGNTAANGPWRVQAVSATTVTLMASIGNAAYTSGGTIQNLDQRDIPLDAVSQGAHSNNSAMVYRINDTDSGGTAGADSFELYGITHSWSERDPHAE